MPLTYICGERISTYGRHGIKIKRRFGEHTELTEIIARGVGSIGTTSRLESTCLCSGVGKRSGEMTLTPWLKGEILV